MIQYLFTVRGKNYIYGTNDNGDGLYKKENGVIYNIIPDQFFTVRGIKDPRNKIRRNLYKDINFGKNSGSDHETQEPSQAPLF